MWIVLRQRPQFFHWWEPVLTVKLCLAFALTSFLLILFPTLILANMRGVTIEGKAPPTYVSETQGKSWAVTIGIDNYENLPRLSYAVADAQAMSKVLARQGFEVTPIYNKKATRRSILRELGRDLLMRVRKEDRVVIFFAGHGETENIGGGHPMGYMMPFDSEPDLLAGTAISMGLIRELSEAIPAKQVLFLIDICYGGIAGRRLRSLTPMTEEYLQIITREPSRQLITAGGPGQKALEGPEWNHSVFTYYLLEGLEKGYADLNSDGIIPASELFAYVDEHVNSASKMRNHAQRPEMWTLTAANGEFVFIPEQASPPIQVAQGPTDQGQMRDPNTNTIETFERLLKKLEQRLEAFEGKPLPPDQEKNQKLKKKVAEEQATLEAQRKAFEIESQKFRDEQKQREEKLKAQLVESRRLAAEEKQQREQAAEQARLEQEAQLAQQQAEIQAEQERLAALEAQRQQALAQKEEELQQQAADARRLAKETEVARLAAEQARLEQEAQLAQQQAELQAEQERLAALEAQRQQALAQKEEELHKLATDARLLNQEAEVDRLAKETQMIQQQAELQAEQQRLAAEEEAKQERALAQKEQELLQQAADARRLAEEVETARLAEEARVAQEQAELQAEQKRLAALEAQRQQALAQKEEELQQQAADARRLAEEAETARLAEEARVAQEQAAQEAEQQRLAAEEEAERAQALAQKEQELQQQAADARRLAEEAETARLAEEARVAQEQAEQEQLAEETQVAQPQNAIQNKITQPDGIDDVLEDSSSIDEIASTPIDSSEIDTSSEQTSGFAGFFENIFGGNNSDVAPETLEEGIPSDHLQKSESPIAQNQKSQPEPILEARLRPSDLPKALSSEVSGKDEAPMVFVPAGVFLMGSTSDEVAGILKDFQGIPFEAFKAEFPQHQVTLNAYEIDRYEVTVNLYGRFLEATNHPPPKFWNNERFHQPALPILGVTWFDAKAYCEWAGKRLPTEAEWENAARGPENYLYPWGNYWGSVHANTASYWARQALSSSDKWASWMQAALDEKKAGPLAANEFAKGKSPHGLHNMSGNISEWVADWFAPYTDQATMVHNPQGKDSGSMKVHRGGSWSVPFVFARTTYRAREKPENSSPYIGFRCARSS